MWSFCDMSIYVICPIWFGAWQSLPSPSKQSGRFGPLTLLSWYIPAGGFILSTMWVQAWQHDDTLLRYLINTVLSILDVLGLHRCGFSWSFCCESHCLAVSRRFPFQWNSKESKAHEVPLGTSWIWCTSWAARSWCVEALNKVRHHIQKKCRSDLCSHPDHLGLLGQMSSGFREPSKRVGYVIKDQDRCDQAIFSPTHFRSVCEWEGRHFQATKKCSRLFKNTLAYTWDILRHIETIRDNLWLTWHVLWLRQVCEPTSQTDGCFEWAWKRGGNPEKITASVPIMSSTLYIAVRRCTMFCGICGILDGCFEAKGGWTKAIGKEWKKCKWE